MKGYHAEEIATLNDEELDNLIKILVEEKQGREFCKCDEYYNKFIALCKEVEEQHLEVLYQGKTFWTDDLDVRKRVF